jgi:hypothetical protein
MKMKLLKTLPLVAATAAAIGLANPVQADSYAVSAANITNLVITTTPFIPIVTGAIKSEASATLGGLTNSSSTTTNALAVNAPGSNALNTRLDNVFNQFGQTNANYSNADGSIDSEQTEGDPFTQVRGIGESFGLGAIGVTGTLGENGSTTGLVTTVEILQGGTTLQFDFKAFKYLQAALTAGSIIPGSSAQATINVVISINDENGNTIFSWNPDGIAGGSIFGGTENSDPFSLNQNIQALFPGQSPTQTSGVGCTITAGNMGVGTGVGNACFGSFSATTNPLLAGTYNLGLSQKLSTSIRSVPVPGTLALIGLGLLGFASSLRRRSTKA